MSLNFVSFDSLLERVEKLFRASWAPLDGVGRIFLVRDLFGVLHIAVSDVFEDSEEIQQNLRGLAEDLAAALGPRASPADSAILFFDVKVLDELLTSGLEICHNVYLVDRLVTGQAWGTVRVLDSLEGAARYTLFSVKGGVGRSTTAAVLAWYLANKGADVMVVDLDLESPGLASAMLESSTQPEYGVTDWFVEDLVGQSDYVIESMVGAPQWAQNLEGDVRVVPAHGRDPGEYLPKLGRVFMDASESWTMRLERMLSRLEEEYKPKVVLLESRSGLNDIAASAVTDLGAQVLLFLTDSESNWTDYEILFRHWQRFGLAQKIRESLSVVSALTPFLDTTRYLSNLKERAWDLFRDYLYDEVDPVNSNVDQFSFDLNNSDAPHNPLVIKWSTELAAGTSLVDSDFGIAASAYEEFFERFDGLYEGTMTYFEVHDENLHES